MRPWLRRIFRWLFFAGAAAGMLVILFYAEEDWRGARAWTAAQRDLHARGESLDIRDLIPPPLLQRRATCRGTGSSPPTEQQRW